MPWWRVKQDPATLALLTDISQTLHRIEHKLGTGGSSDQLGELMATVEEVAAQVDRVEAETAQQTTLAESAEALLNGLSAQIADLKDDPAALQALADRLSSASAAGESANQRLAAALAANSADVGEAPPEEPVG